ncbi:MAG: 5-(carboxyamino)imidazole ribonucleotide synthase [Oleiphilaceae bacterium]|nr:5-(carboxyamino)imidazole ribonucleotide synthase [Oleiphilaceae bacterium]
MKSIGVLGAGQLGRMLALAGLPLEAKFRFFDTSGSPSVGLEPTYSVKDKPIESQELQEFIDACDVITYEFEHLPVELTQHIEKEHTLYPPSKSIEICQDREKEKALFNELSIPTTRYKIIHKESDLSEVVQELGLPLVCKTTREGYDGKGQFILRSAKDIPKAWSAIGSTTLIAEEFINFSRELSIIAARSASGEIAIYPLAENQHNDGILRFSTVPAPSVNEDIQRQADLYIKDLIAELEHVGILTLELFETTNGLVANEMAPRVHNSGHWSMLGAHCSQFENHIRAICDLPLGSTEALSPTCMINLISHKGDIRKILELPYAQVHLYDKEERAGRKLGHINVTASSYEELKWRVENIVQFLPDYPQCLQLKN